MPNNFAVFQVPSSTFTSGLTKFPTCSAAVEYARAVAGDLMVRKDHLTPNGKSITV